MIRCQQRQRRQQTSEMCVCVMARVVVVNSREESGAREKLDCWIRLSLQETNNLQNLNLEIVR